MTVIVEALHLAVREDRSMLLHLGARVFLIATLAGVLSASGCSSPATTPSTSGSTTAATPAGSVQLTAYTDNDGPTSTVILSGAVGDYGKARSVNPDGSVNPNHTSQLNLVLAHGSFRLSVADLDKKFVAVLAGLRVNTTTCSGTASASGSVPVVAGSGTGPYKGVHGTFVLTITLDEVYRPSGCSETSGGYLSEALVMTGSGRISLG